MERSAVTQHRPLSGRRLSCLRRGWTSFGTEDLNKSHVRIVPKIVTAAVPFAEIKIQMKRRGLVCVELSKVFGRRFSTKESATHAIVAVHNTDINGQTVKCSWGKESGDPNNAQAAGQVGAPASSLTACITPHNLHHTSQPASPLTAWISPHSLHHPSQPASPLTACITHDYASVISQSEQTAKLFDKVWAALNNEVLRAEGGEMRCDWSSTRMHGGTGDSRELPPISVTSNCSPPTKANRAQSPAGSPDFRKWESSRTRTLVGGFSRECPVSPAPSFRYRSILASITLIGSQDLAVKESPKSLHSLTGCLFWYCQGCRVRKTFAGGLLIAPCSVITVACAVSTTPCTTLPPFSLAPATSITQAADHKTFPPPLEEKKINMTSLGSTYSKGNVLTDDITGVDLLEGQRIVWASELRMGLTAAAPIYRAELLLLSPREIYLGCRFPIGMAWASSELFSGGPQVPCQKHKVFRVEQSRDTWSALNNEILRVYEGEHGAAPECKGGTREKIRRPAAWFGTIHTCQDPRRGSNPVPLDKRSNHYTTAAKACHQVPRGAWPGGGEVVVDLPVGWWRRDARVAAPVAMGSWRNKEGKGGVVVA
ncbi:hypothetical protein PR048_016747 [Dryococelus australis]|uniref:Uncharacterized protein n=1 Tax=Dryococelus australis TaxID=614101 RepID=A0ABQ9H7S7_9NEOP|nr:hypothetical protein PR048_016747 [Dryococelus australis]